jgi:hypothetical protein
MDSCSFNEETHESHTGKKLVFVEASHPTQCGGKRASTTIEKTRCILYIVYENEFSVEVGYNGNNEAEFS